MVAVLVDVDIVAVAIVATVAAVFFISPVSGVVVT